MSKEYVKQDTKKFIKKFSDSITKANKSRNISLHVKEHNMNYFKDLVEPTRMEIK